MQPTVPAYRACVTLKPEATRGTFQCFFASYVRRYAPRCHTVPSPLLRISRAVGAKRLVPCTMRMNDDAAATRLWNRTLMAVVQTACLIVRQSILHKYNVKQPHRRSQTDRHCLHRITNVISSRVGIAGRPYTSTLLQSAMPAC